MATALANRADVHRALGGWREALAGYAAAFESYAAIRASWYRASAAAGVATALTGLGRHRQAAELYGAVDAELDRLRVPMHPLDQPPYVGGRNATCEHIGASAFERLAAVGAGWTDRERAEAVQAAAADGG